MRRGPTDSTRRAVLRGADVVRLGAFLPHDPALAHAAGETLRIGMTLAAIPLSNGLLDQVGEGRRSWTSRAMMASRRSGPGRRTLRPSAFASALTGGTR